MCVLYIYIYVIYIYMLYLYIYIYIHIHLMLGLHYGIHSANTFYIVSLSLAKTIYHAYRKVSIGRNDQNSVMFYAFKTHTDLLLRVRTVVLQRQVMS